MKLWIVGFLLSGFAQIASANEVILSGSMILFRDAACNAPVMAMPVGNSSVNCERLPGNNNWIMSLRIAGDTTCIPISQQYATDICKAYNGK